MKKVLLILAAIVVCAGVALYAFRETILLNALGVVTDIRHPRAPNRPVPWQQGPPAAEIPAAQRPPNIIVILADDLGINDVSLYGGGNPRSPTPHIDSLAKNGVRFDNGYAGNAVCAPSRATLMTGRYSSRFGYEFTPTPGNMAKVAPLLAGDIPRIHHPVLHPEAVERIAPFEQLGMPPSEVTLAEMLKERGYHNIHIGKWHLGGTPELRPNAQGFDETLFMESGLYLPEDHPEAVNAKQDFDPIDRFLWPNMRYAASYNAGDWFEPRGYLTDYYTDEAVASIRANRNRPFFLFLAHWAVHTPMQALKADYDALEGIEPHGRRVNAAMVRSLDRSVGRVLQALKDEGLHENTLVIFTSDNGAPNYLGLPELNQPYRGWKLTYFEGGLKVAFAAQWPARIPAGTVYGDPIAAVDITPTAIAAAGAAMPADREHDGVNLLPFLTGEKSGPAHEALFWTDGSYQVVIAGGWKLQVAERPAKTWLYHLTKDPTERNELSAAEPGKLAELRELLAMHRARSAPPLWPSFLEMPVMVDKTLDQPEVEGDEIVYWQN
ncbi:MAG TPA: sulfatase-like hydrolase/transferase [Verrucomicrobiae bacterium]|nr:sulfatase-like hydrolase/transferase [Verrucomicrobiae bacterium]